MENGGVEHSFLVIHNWFSVYWVYCVITVQFTLGSRRGGNQGPKMRLVLMTHPSMG